MDGVEHGNFTREDGGNVGAGAVEVRKQFRQVAGTKEAGRRRYVDGWRQVRRLRHGVSERESEWRIDDVTSFKWLF